MTNMIPKQEVTRASHGEFFGAYKTYNEIDLMGLRSINNLLEARKRSTMFDIECLVSIYMGESVFSIEEHDTLYLMIEQRLKEEKLDPDEELEVEHQLSKRMFQVLMTPQPRLLSKQSDQDSAETEVKTEAL